MNVYITGDKHGNFYDLFEIQNRLNLFKKEDILIILGDSGFNYYVHKNMINNGRQYKCDRGNLYEKRIFCENLPCTTICIHGNHEARPETIEGYLSKQWNGGTVYYQQKYPNLLFAKDGSIFNIKNKSYLAIGGAYSVDKWFRLSSGLKWFSDEQPSDKTKDDIQKVLNENNWSVDYVLSHTCPYKYIPKELFISGIDQTTVDDSTEIWLDSIEEKLDYTRWFFGHYHGEKEINKMRMLFNEVIKVE